jgi:hypothetical protein
MLLGEIDGSGSGAVKGLDSNLEDLLNQYVRRFARRIPFAKQIFVSARPRGLKNIKACG